MALGDIFEKYHGKDKTTKQACLKKLLLQDGDALQYSTTEKLSKRKEEHKKEQNKERETLTKRLESDSKLILQSIGASQEEF